jgi:tRNA (cmo5U34)-methyltransferase
MKSSSFDFSTIENFDSHISSSISGYDLLKMLIFNISTFFMKEDSGVIDFGCTSGDLLIKLSNKNDNCKFIGFDKIESNFINNDSVELIKKDITSKEFTIPKNNLSLCIFTLQFLPYDKRIELLKKIYDSIDVGGALIICEKEIEESGAIQEIFTFSNYSYKTENFSADEILKKESQLRSSMKCLSEKENIKILKKSGFKIISCFFKSLSFKGYICIKEF